MSDEQELDRLLHEDALKLSAHFNVPYQESREMLQETARLQSEINTRRAMIEQEDKG